MTSFARRMIVCTVAASLACVALSGCANGARDYAGVVVNDTVTLQAPALLLPAVDLDAGFAPSGTGDAVAGARRGGTTVAAITSLGSVVRVKSVAVQAGDVVTAGAEIARLDSAALDANVAVAKATNAAAKAQVGVLDDALDTVTSSRATLASKRREVNDAAAQLASTRATLSLQLADLKALLTKLESMGGGTPPPGGVPTGTPPPATPPDPAQVRAGIAKLTAALAKIDAGLAKVASGRAQLSSASAKLSDARTQLTGIRSLALVAIDASAVGVRLAEYQRDLAVVRTPVSGRIVSVVTAGEVLAPGATIAVARRQEAPRVTTWIAPENVGGLRAGSLVDVRADWFASGSDAIGGSVSSISPRAEYPPTSFATGDVHLTRAIRVEITLSPSADDPALPPGAPVDVRFLR